MEIKLDDLSGTGIEALLAEHMDNMMATSPAESVHALDIESLRAPDITFWSVWEGEQLAGCGALKEHDSSLVEIKSMRTAETHRRRGVAGMLLEYLLDVASESGYQRMSLETGSQDEFNPARKLYASFGFEECRPFAEYLEDPHSVFMTKQLFQPE